MRRLVAFSLVFASLSALAGCGGGGGAHVDCTGIPTMDPGNVESIPHFSPDPALAPTFPDIDPVLAPAITYGRWLDSACVFGGDAVVQPFEAALPNVDFGKLSWGIANDTTGEAHGFASIFLLALRTPGRDASDVNRMFGPLLFGLTGSKPDAFTFTQTSATYGGKSVTVWTNTGNSDPTYVYMAGDTVYGLVHGKEQILDLVFEALP